MPRYEYDKLNDLLTLHIELESAGISPQTVEGRGNLVWITVPAEFEAQVSAVVDAHDGAAATLAKHWSTARAERDTRLRNSDWIGVTDTQLTEADQTSWQTYRQALRDVPQNQNDPENITWPDAPSD